MWKRKKTKFQDIMKTAQKERESLLKRYPSLNRLLSEEPGTSPWYQRQNKQVFTTPKGPLNWSRSNDELFLLNSEGDVVGIVRDGTIVKQVDSHRLLVSYEVRYLNKRRDDPANTNALNLSIVNIDELGIIKDFRTEATNMKNHMRQFVIAGSLDANCAVPLKVSEGVHRFVFPDDFKLLNEILHISDYLPQERLTGQLEDVALFVLRPRKNEYEVFPQDWYNLKTWDAMYMFPDKATRDPTSGRIFIRGIRIGDIVLDESNRREEKG